MVREPTRSVHRSGLLSRMRVAFFQPESLRTVVIVNFSLKKWVWGKSPTLYQKTPKIGSYLSSVNIYTHGQDADVFVTELCAVVLENRFEFAR